MARKLDRAKKSGLGKWGIRGERGPGACWGFMIWGPFGSHLGSLLFGAHLGSFLFVLGPSGPSGAHFIWGGRTTTKLDWVHAHREASDALACILVNLLSN